MIDFHSHILPNFDDGAQNMDMTLKMLSDSAESGVETIISTSHCYPKDADQIICFANRRAKRFQSIEEALKERGIKAPKILKGAEVNLITDFSGFKNIDRICIENTKYILVEMPAKKWTEDVYDTIFSLGVKGYRPVIAHIERYVSAKKELLNLSDMKPVYQINADCFLTAKGRILAYNLIKSGMAHIIGSDMHDDVKRPTKMKKAYEMIEKYFGEEYVSYFKENGEKILKNEELDKKRYKALKPINKFLLLF